MRKPSSTTGIVLLIVGLVAAIVVALFVITGMFGLVGTSDSPQIPKVATPAERVYGGLDKVVVTPKQIVEGYSESDAQKGAAGKPRKAAIDDGAYSPANISVAVGYIPGAARRDTPIDATEVIGGYTRRLTSHGPYPDRSIVALKFTSTAAAQKFLDTTPRTIVGLSPPERKPGTSELLPATHTTLTVSGSDVPAGTDAFTTPAYEPGKAVPMIWEARFVKGNVAFDVYITSTDGGNHQDELLELVKTQASLA